MRDQPDRVKADFLNSLADMDPLYKSELDYILAYRQVDVEEVRVFNFFYRDRVHICSAYYLSLFPVALPEEVFSGIMK